MKRRLFNLAAATSLALCIGTVALWVRSFWSEYGVTYADPTGEGFGLTASRGELGYISQPISPNPGFQFIAFPFREGFLEGTGIHSPGEISGWSGGPDWSFAGLARTGAFGITVMPLWMPAVIASMVPGLWVFRRFRHLHRLKSLRCSTCGYDLRESPDRCPECGTPAVSSSK